jgi:hypothetical protein
MGSVNCVRGWQRLSTWTYVCTIHWRDGTHVTGHVEVDALTSACTRRTLAQKNPLPFGASETLRLV